MEARFISCWCAVQEAIAVALSLDKEFKKPSENPGTLETARVRKQFLASQPGGSGAVLSESRACESLGRESCFRALLSPLAPRQAQTCLSWKEVRPPPQREEGPSCLWLGFVLSGFQAVSLPGGRALGC